MASKEFKIQVLETFASLITAAFGLVAALAWNETIKSAVAKVFGEANDLVGLLIYAIIVTVLAVIMTIYIARTLGKAKDAVENDKKN